MQKEKFKGKMTVYFEILPEASQLHLPKDTKRKASEKCIQKGGKNQTAQSPPFYSEKLKLINQGMRGNSCT